MSRNITPIGKDRRKFLWWTIVVGLAGMLTGYLFYLFLLGNNSHFEGEVSYQLYEITLILPLLLLLLNKQIQKLFRLPGLLLISTVLILVTGIGALSILQIQDAELSWDFGTSLSLCLLGSVGLVFLTPAILAYTADQFPGNLSFHLNLIFGTLYISAGFQLTNLFDLAFEGWNISHYLRDPGGSGLSSFDGEHGFFTSLIYWILVTLVAIVLLIVFIRMRRRAKKQGGYQPKVLPNSEHPFVSSDQAPQP